MLLSYFSDHPFLSFHFFFPSNSKYGWLALSSLLFFIYVSIGFNLGIGYDGEECAEGIKYILDIFSFSDHTCPKTPFPHEEINGERAKD